jgi:hypothetical protein
MMTDLSGHGDGAALAEQLVATAAELGADELRVLLLIATRLAAGRRYYGELHLATDRRDFRAEGAEELLDAVVYLAAATLRGAGC